MRVPVLWWILFVFFQAEDGIRDWSVTGVQTCALPFSITIFGYFSSIFAFRRLGEWFDHLVNRIPLVKLVYSSIKDLLAEFVGDKQKFDRPVLVTINKENQLHRIGFITQSDLTELGLKDMVVVYFPQSYAVAGDHFVVPRESVKTLDVDGAVAMKF